MAALSFISTREIIGALRRIMGAGSGSLECSEYEASAPGLRLMAGHSRRRAIGWNVSSPQRSASSTFARASASAGYSGGSGRSSSSRRRIAREPLSFSPFNRSAGTVREPKRTRWIAACIGGGSSTVLVGNALHLQGLRDGGARVRAVDHVEPCLHRGAA